MTTAIKRNKVEHLYRPRGTAKAIFSDRRKEVLVVGPYGTGKSRACLEKLHLVCLLRPNVRALMSRSRYDWLRDAACRTFTDHVAAEHIQAEEIHVYGGTVPKQIQYKNGSTIDVVGLTDINRVMSVEYDLIYVQEAVEIEDQSVWERLGSRLRGTALSYRQLLADCNPASEHHWLHLRCLEGRTVEYNSTHEENPVYFNDDGSQTPLGAEYITWLESSLTGIWLQRGRYGKWVGAQGVIYDNFDSSFHVIDPFEIPQEWTRYWSVDFGFSPTHPFVLQCWAEDPDGRLYLYREIYRTNRLVEDHARQILNLVTDSKGQWTEPKPSAIICDHDAEDRATLQRHLHLGTTPARKTVSDGLQACHARLSRKADGRARIYFFRNAVVDVDQTLTHSKKPSSTVQEFGGYIWDPKGKDQPLKQFDDGMDAMRYMVAHKDLRTRAAMEWV